MNRNLWVLLRVIALLSAVSASFAVYLLTPPSVATITGVVTPKSIFKVEFDGLFNEVNSSASVQANGTYTVYVPNSNWPYLIQIYIKTGSGQTTVTNCGTWLVNQPTKLSPLHYDIPSLPR